MLYLERSFPFEMFFRELAELNNTYNKRGGFMVTNDFIDRMVVHRSLTP